MPPTRRIRACAHRSSPVRGRPSALNAASVRCSERHIETLRDGPFVESPGVAAGDLCPGMGVSAPGCMARVSTAPVAAACCPCSPGCCHVLCAAGREVAPRGTAGTLGLRVGTAQGGLTMFTCVGHTEPGQE